MSKIFISYRRDDAQGVAGRLMDTLSVYFGDGRVFRDIEGIEGGANFEDVLTETIGAADAVIVLIGPNWLNATDDAGQHRLQDPNDWVAREIADALQKDLPVFPVLIEDTPMPRAEDLPESLKPLVRHNAISISDKRWSFDVTRLAKIVALDIPGSAVERQLDMVRWVCSLSLFAAIFFTTTIVAWNCYKHYTNESCEHHTKSNSPPIAGTDSDEDAKKAPLSFAQSGVPFVPIVLSSVLLLMVARSVDESKRQFIFAAGVTGLLGTLVCFILIFPLPDPVEENMSSFFGSTVTATAMLVLMNVSGFKPK